MRSLFFVMLFISSNALSKRAQNYEVSAPLAMVAPRPTFEVPVTTVQTYYLGLKKTRALTEQETHVQNLATVAGTLKIAGISSYAQNPAGIQSAALGEAIVKKISEHPKWDTNLSTSDLQSIKPHLDLVKTTLGEKSYGWAWFLKQNGKSAEAKQILTSLFNEKSAEVLRVNRTYNNVSPMIPVVQIEQALTPLSTESERVQLHKKMQELKVHVSNLKDYTIMT